MDIRVTRIGKVDAKTEGWDEHLLVENREGELTPEQAEQWVLSRVYREGNGAGSYFCHNVIAVQYPFSDSKVIAIVHHRYDV